MNLEGIYYGKPLTYITEDVVTSQTTIGYKELSKELSEGEGWCAFIIISDYEFDLQIRESEEDAKQDMERLKTALLSK